MAGVRARLLNMVERSSCSYGRLSNYLSLRTETPFYLIAKAKLQRSQGQIVNLDKSRRGVARAGMRHSYRLMRFTFHSSTQLRRVSL